ncbi:PIN domain protein [Treponema primitia ZAS-2]|uniref:PIN domain protein n=1 Tax=Treponema primitia (strain ATCC BAA-887 / DSM 12427 / ZAS-2) TaxID=545694 RepID=F5YLT0_TREPZ|nr:PIN domain-containing protein [Treponema primitia]AEF83882.1 PIN domain protein [Treponema primitia ZAS-2]
MEKVFIDSDIILDVLLYRDPFALPAAELFELGSNSNVQLFTTPVVLANVFYMLRKSFGNDKAKTKLYELRSIIHIVPINEKTVDSGLSSKFSDFEDSLQYFAAKENKITILVTRNTKDYPIKDMAVQTAEEYIKSRTDGTDG